MGRQEEGSAGSFPGLIFPFAGQMACFYTGHSWSAIGWMAELMCVASRR